jgi:hypothetical protein
MEDLVGQTGESTSIAQLDGSDIVYVARVAVPKIITFAVAIGTRFPALQTSLGKVLLAALTPEEVEERLAQPSRSGIEPRWQPTREEREQHLREVRARGWAVADEHLAAGIRSAAGAAAGRGGARRGGDERDRPRRRDHARDADRRSTCPGCSPRLAGSATTSRCVTRSPRSPRCGHPWGLTRRRGPALAGGTVTT